MCRPKELSILLLIHPVAQSLDCLDECTSHQCFEQERLTAVDDAFVPSQHSTLHWTVRFIYLRDYFAGFPYLSGDQEHDHCGVPQRYLGGDLWQSLLQVSC